MKINSAKVLFTQLGEEGVIFDIEKNEYYALNDSYFAILSHISKGLELEEIIQELMEQFEVEEERCRAEVLAVVKELREKLYII